MVNNYYVLISATWSVNVISRQNMRRRMCFQHSMDLGYSVMVTVLADTVSMVVMGRWQ